MKPGQPLRFLGWILGGWVAMRATMLLIPAVEGVGEPLAAERAEAQTSEALLARLAPGHRVARSSSTADHAVDALPYVPPRGPDAMMRSGVGAQPANERVVLAALPQSRIGRPDRDMPGWRQAESGNVAGPAAGRAMDMERYARVSAAAGSRSAAPSPWSGTAWMLWRPEMAGGLAQAPLLGGSQLGARLDYRIASGGLGQIGLYGRVSRALTGAPSEEAALGVTLRPARTPVTMLAERRQRVGRSGRNGFALLVAGGVGPREVAHRLAVEGYAQAGVVGLPGLDGFADGKASVGYRLSPERAVARVTLGGSVSGSVQTGASRLDIGPEMSLHLPAGAATIRLSVEWRERILGDARPARGPAITLVSGF